MCEYDDYHEALDDIVSDFKGPIFNIMERQGKFDNKTASLACELMCTASLLP